MNEDGTFESEAEVESLPAVGEFTDMKIEDETDEVAIAWRESPGNTIGRIRMPLEQAVLLTRALGQAVAELKAERGMPGKATPAEIPTVEEFTGGLADTATGDILIEWRETQFGRSAGLRIPAAQAARLATVLEETLLVLGAKKRGPEAH